LQFYSDPGDPNDTKLPDTDTKIILPETDLSTLTNLGLTQDGVALPGLGGFLKGKVGALYIAGPLNVGGTAGANEKIAYIFVSDGDTGNSDKTGGGTGTPEPRMLAPVGCAVLVLILLTIRSRRHAAMKNRV
jgi:hypothetical protein